METILDDGDIDIDDVAGPKLAIAGNAVAHDVVNRRADRLWEPAVIEWCRNGLLHINDVVMANPVEFARGDASADMGANHVEDIGSQPPGDAHQLLLFGCLDAYVH